MNLDGSVQRPLTDNRWEEGTPAWQPVPLPAWQPVMLESILLMDAAKILVVDDEKSILLLLKEALEPAEIAVAEPRRLDEVFREKPAIHRFPGNMARRVQDLAAVVAEDYDGDAERVWGEAADGTDLRKRIAALPGFGEMKVKALGAVLAKRLGVEAAQELAPSHPTLGDVDSIEALEAYQAKKRAYKASMRAAKAP